MAQAAVSVVEQGIPTLAGFVKHDLGISAATAGFLVSSINVGRILGSYPAGSAVDRIGERFVLVVGGVTCGLIVVLASLSPLAALFPLLIVAGFFSATSTPAGGKLVMVSFPRSRRGFAMGVRQTGIPLGGLVAASLLPWIASSWSWRASVLVGGVIVAAGVSIVPLMAGIDSRAERRAARAAAAARPRAAPAKDRDLLLVTLWGCLLVGGQYTMLAFLALDISGATSLSLATAALLLVVAQVGGIAGRIGWGILSDTALKGRRQPLLIGITLVGLLTAIALAVLPGRAPLALVGLAAFVGGLSLIGWQGIWLTIVSEIAGPERAGVTTGFGLTFIAIAIAASPALYGLVADVTGSFSAIWIVLACVLAVALVPAALVREPVR